MTAEEFKERVSRLLGVAPSESELAYRILLNKTADILEFYDALKVGGLGVFQFKKDENGAPDYNSVVFVPAGVVNAANRKNMYLILPVNRNTGDEFDESIFSPGLGKDILAPAENFEQNSGIDSLQKHLERKVDEILAASEQLENFDIWENYNLVEQIEPADDAGVSEEENNKLDLEDLEEEFINFDEEEQAESEEFKTEEPEELPEADEVVEPDDTIDETPEEEEIQNYDESDTDEKSGEFLKSSISIDFDFDKLGADIIDEEDEKEPAEEEPQDFSFDELEDLKEDTTPEEKEEPEQKIPEQEENEEEWFSFDDFSEENEDKPETIKDADEVVNEPEDTEEEEFTDKDEDSVPKINEDEWGWNVDDDESEEEHSIEESDDELKDFGEPEESFEEDIQEDEEEFLFDSLEKDLEDFKEKELNGTNVDEETDDEFPLPEDNEDEEDNDQDVTEEKKKTTEEKKFKLPPIIEVKEVDEEDGTVHGEASFIPSKTDSDEEMLSEESDEKFDKKTWEEIYKDFDFKDVKKGNKKEEINKLHERSLKNKNFSRNLLIILVFMLLLASGALYFFIMDDGDKENNTVPPSESIIKNSENSPIGATDGTEAEEESRSTDEVDAKLDEIISEQENNNSSNTNNSEPVAGNNATLPPVQNNQENTASGDLYMEFPAGSEVRSLIYELNGKYYVQVASVRDPKAAEREAKRFINKGLEAHIAKAFINARNTYFYRVKIGPYNSLNEAQSFLDKNKN